jgi:hypothetical protein
MGPVDIVGYLVFGAIVAAIVLGYWRMSVALRSWRQPPPGRDPQAK